MRKVVTVFGSSMPKPGEEEYETAYELGKILGSNGFNVCSGGYQGIMDAVSKGVTETGGKAIGITVNIFSAKVSQYLSEEINCQTLFSRIEKLIEIGDAYIILRGGTGTLVELSIVWEMFNKNLMNEKPIACHGEMWKSLVKTIDERMQYENRKFGFVYWSNEIRDCADYIIKNVAV
ncbi:MAG: LOG family protein [Melioribacteraceae bacterium]|nr:LOG family protein [Melioribacteraceae bacterium]WKZ70283.1 MAG: LOG family protein [Melioribacteraceae bacterium]